MRVTNKMIMNNASSNINSTKEIVNTRNKQMTSQKRIDKPSDDPIYDDRSQNLYYYLNGFELNGNGNEILWEPFENVSYDAEPIYRGHRKNVFMLNEDGSKKIENEVIELDEKQWAFSKRENTIVTHSHAKAADYIKFSKKERYGITQGEFI